MDDTRKDLVREDGPGLPGRRQFIGAGIALAAASLLPQGIARAQGQGAAGRQHTAATHAHRPAQARHAGGLQRRPWRPEHEPHLSNDDPDPVRDDQHHPDSLRSWRHLFDAAEAYGPHEVERILGEGVAPFRDKVVITSKFGWNIDLETGERRPGLNSRPDHIKLAVEGMLKRLRTDRIDLLYQHRVDPQVPIEDVAGAVKDLMAQGKVLHWGLSEMGPNTLRRAHAALPVTAVQNEYSMLWRGPEEVGDPALRGTGHRLRPVEPARCGFPHRCH